MDGVKMDHRSYPAALPSIHRGTGVPKLSSDYSHDGDQDASLQHQISQSSNNTNRQNINYASTKSFDATGGRVSNNSSLDALLPQVGDDEPIDMGRIRIERRSHKNLLPPSIRHLAGSKMSQSQPVNQLAYVSASFDPLPFQPQYFKSSTLLKMVPVLRRHQDMFFDKSQIIPREKPLIIHSERYQYSEPLKPGFERLGQRERLLAEREYITRLKQQKQARETLPHRESKDLLMGGQRVPFNERFDVRDELRRLKAIVLPMNARELYHGKGITLPPTHSSIKPRKFMPPPLPVASPDPEDLLVKEAAMYRHSKTSLDGLQTRKTLKKTKDVKSVFDNQVRTGPLTGRMESVPHSAALSRRSTESNFMNLPGDGDCLPDLPRTPVMESEGDFLRSTSREQHSSMQRVESEMDIIIPPENENTSTAKSAKVRTPIKAPTPNPLKAADLTLYHIKEEEMKAMFQKLDTDDDGHLMYQQVEPQFPQSLQPNQKKYLKQIYDITSASTYFGVKEFVTIKCLCEEVSKLDHQLMLRGFEKLDFPNLTTSVIQYTELFQQVDRASKGKITLDSLRDIICTALQKDKDHLEYGLSQLSDVLNLGDNDSVNKVKFIAGIPYYLTVASLEKPETENEETPLK